MTHTIDALYKLSFRELVELTLRLQRANGELKSDVAALSRTAEALDRKLDELYKAEAQQCLNLYRATYTATDADMAGGGTRFTIRLDPLVGSVVVPYRGGRFAVPGYVDELAKRAARLLVETVAAQHRTPG